MAGLTADQIIARIANGAEPAVMRQQIEQALQNIIVDTTQPHSFMLANLFPGGKPTVDGRYDASISWVGMGRRGVSEYQIAGKKQ